MPHVSKAIAKQAVDAVCAALLDGVPAIGRPNAYGTAARRLGWPRATLRDRVEIAAREFGLVVPAELKEGAPLPVPGREDVSAALIRKLKEHNQALQTENRELRRGLDAAHNIRETAFRLAESGIAPPDWSPKARKGKSSDTPVLLTSDFQWGEVIHAPAMDYQNEYNVEIARKRYRTLIENTLDICANHTANPSFDRFYYLRGGDTISGAIHDSLAETDELTPIQAVQSVAAEEARGIEILRERFKEVIVVSVGGNHDRNTMKIRDKKYAGHSYATLVAWHLETHFRDDKAVTFYTPESGDAYFQVCGRNFLLTHGDRIGSRGGAGFVGPALPIIRGAKKVMEEYATMGKPIDYLCIGHFHYSLHDGVYGIISNGCLPGYSEYARMNRMKPAKPSQRLFFVHPDHGVCQMREVFV